MTLSAFTPTHHGEAKETAARASKKQKYMASSVVRIAPHKNSIRRNAAPLTQIPPRTVSEGYQARKRTAVVSRSRAETLYEDDRRMGGGLWYRLRARSPGLLAAWLCCAGLNKKAPAMAPFWWIAPPSGLALAFYARAQRWTRSPWLSHRH